MREVFKCLSAHDSHVAYYGYAAHWTAALTGVVEPTVVAVEVSIFGWLPEMGRADARVWRLRDASIQDRT